MSSKNACFDSLLDSIVKQRNIHYVTYRVESGAGDLIYAGARGQADASGRMMRPDTPYFIASIDKLMTATVLLQLMEEGKVDLADSITGHLPDWAWKGIHQNGDANSSQAITVRHLLTHTSGLGEWIEDRPKSGKSLVDEVLAAGDRRISDEEAMDRVRILKPHFAPRSEITSGTRARYSDTNFVLLRLIVERAEDENIGPIFKRRIFERLGLDHTWVLGQTEPTGSAEPALLWAGRDPLDIPEFLTSLNSVYASTSDQIAFLRGLLAGRLFRETSTIDAMRRPWVKFGFALDPAALRAPGWPIEYGLGIKRLSYPRWLTPRKPVPTVIGHSGSTGTWLLYCEELDAFVAGCVGQVTAAAVPFRTLPRQLACVREAAGAHA